MSRLPRVKAEGKSAVQYMDGRHLRGDRTSNEVSCLGGQGESQVSHIGSESDDAPPQPLVDSGREVSGIS
jgi:hypothetical protein